MSVQQYIQPAPVYHGTLTNHSGVIGGSSLNIPLPSGAFTEPDGGALTYSAMVLIPAHTLEVWNASHTEILDENISAQWVALSSVGLSINATNGTITGVPKTLDYVISEVSTPYQYAHDTSYQIEIVATNGQSETAAGTFTLSNTYAPPTVLNPIANPPAQNAGVGYLRVVQDNTFSDPAGYGLTYTATLSSGAALPSGLTWSGSSIGIGTVAAGTYTIKITATDHGSASSTFTLTVNNVAPVFGAYPVNLTAVKGSAMTPYTAPVVPDPNGDAVSYSASNLPPGIVFNASTRTFSGTPTSTGTWTVTYKATDSHGASASKTFTITVSAPAPQPPVYNGGIPTPIDLDKNHRTYTIPSTAFSSPSGEALTYSVSTLPTYLSFSGSTRTFTLVTIPNQGEISAFTTLTVADTDGRSITERLSFDILGSGTVNAIPAGGTLDTQSTTSADTTTVADGTQVTQQTTTTTPNILSYWFTYDADNRVDIDGGDLVSGQIQVVARTGSVEHEYDQAGKVVTELSNGGVGYGIQTQTFSYDVRGNQIGSVLTSSQVETKQYDADGRLVADVYTYAPGTIVHFTSADFPNNTGKLNISGWLSGATTYYYNADGEVYATFDYSRNASQDYWNNLGREDDGGTLNADAQKAIPDTLPSLSDAANGAGYGNDGSGNAVLTLSSHVSHWDPSTGTGGYDKEDNALVYTYSVAGGHTTTYRVSYLKQDGYLEKATAGTSDDPNVLATTDTSLYDAFGRRIAIDTHSAGQTTDQVRAFAYDAEGEILQRRDGTATGSTFTVTANGGYSVEHYAYVQGQQVGNVDEHGTINVLGGVTGFSNSDAGTSNYVAQDGDTMQSIAQQVYGDGSLWYVVADANGFDAATDAPAAGQTLKLPQVTTNSNTAETFKPYNPREISGSTTPSLPQAPMPAPSAHHCNTLAAIVVIAVVVVASIFTAGVAAEAFAGTLGTAAGGGAAGIMAAGGAALTGGAVAGATAGELVASAAIGGALGNAAGQLVGDAEGIHQGFSWGEMAGAGLGAGITAGLAGEISGGAKIADLAKDGAMGYAKIAGIGAASAAGNYAGEKLVGQPAHFSWANVAAAAIGTEVTSALHLPTTLEQEWGQVAGGSFAANVVGGLVNGTIDSETARLLGGDAKNGNQIAIDAFGNALGNAAIAGIEHENAVSEQKQTQPTSSLLSADNPNSQVNPVAAFLSGPLASTGNDAEALTGYDPFNGPLLASADGYSTYTGVYGPPSSANAGSSDYLSLSGESEKAKEMDQLYSLVAQEQDRGAPPIGITNPSATDLIDYLKEYVDVGVPPAGAPTLATITVTSSTEDLAQTSSDTGLSGLFGDNSLSDFGPSTASWIDSLYGSSRPATESSSGNSDFLSNAATGLDWVSTGATSAGLLSGAFGKPWALSWGSSRISTSILLQNGGKAPSWLANPEFTWSVATDSSNVAFDLRFIGKAAPWLERGGETLGGLSAGVEVYAGFYNHDKAQIGRGLVDGTVWAGSLALSPFITPLGSFAVGLLWTGADMLAQDYTYQGNNGWTAVGMSLRDKIGPVWHDVWSAQEQMRKQDPQFYNQLWAQPKE